MGCVIFVNKITYKPSKLGQADLVLVCDQSSSAGLCMQEYKSLCVASSYDLVNHTHKWRDRHTDKQLLTPNCHNYLIVLT